MEQEGLHKFKKELLDVRLDGGENSAQGTADAKCAPSCPISTTPHVLLLLDLDSLCCKQVQRTPCMESFSLACDVKLPVILSIMGPWQQSARRVR